MKEMRALVGLFTALAAGLASCSDPPPEPASRESIVAELPEEPLRWDAPAGWTTTESSTTGPRRAGYAVPKVGDDKEDAELLVLYFGKGKNSERDAQWDSWFEQFDGDAKRDAARETFAVGDKTVETFEFTGNYKLNMGPQRPGMKRSPVQMVKKDFRMIGAVVSAPGRGNWFFRLVGPDETVRASRASFVEMLKSVR